MAQRCKKCHKARKTKKGLCKACRHQDLLPAVSEKKP